MMVHCVLVEGICDSVLENILFHAIIDFELFPYKEVDEDSVDSAAKDISS